MQDPVLTIAKKSVTISMATIYNYHADRLDLDFWDSFLDAEESDWWLDFLESTVFTKTPTPHRRSNQNYGDPGISYTLRLGGYGSRPLKIIERPVLEWLPDLKDLKDRVELATKAKYNYCVVQRYPSGRVGINPHRDKEMVSGTTIAGISLGQTRTLTMGPPRWLVDEVLPVDIELGPGSMYVLKPPTNDYWSHCIQRDSTTECRLSLTFRLVP